MKKVSIIIYIYNQEEHIVSFFTQLKDILASYTTIFNYEIIFINDGSTDHSWQILTQLAQTHALKAINLSRKWGFNNALKAGYKFSSKEDTLIYPTKNLSSSPETKIKSMVQQWQCKKNTHYFKDTTKTHTGSLTMVNCIIGSNVMLIVIELIMLDIITSPWVFFSHHWVTFVVLHILLGFQAILLWLIHVYSNRIKQQLQTNTLYSINEAVNIIFEVAKVKTLTYIFMRRKFNSKRRGNEI